MAPMPNATWPGVLLWAMTRHGKGVARDAVPSNSTRPLRSAPALVTTRMPLMSAPPTDNGTAAVSGERSVAANAPIGWTFKT